jgi:hypothetical protein
VFYLASEKSAKALSPKEKHGAAPQKMKMTGDVKRQKR